MNISIPYMVIYRSSIDHLNIGYMYIYIYTNMSVYRDLYPSMGDSHGNL